MPTPLNPDILSDVFLLLDLAEYPNVALTCRTWNAVLSSKTVEDGLWLSLVRKYHPIVERITYMLPQSLSKKGGASVDYARAIWRWPNKRAKIDAKVDALTGPAALSNVPPPSRNWKKQFKRRQIFTSTEGLGRRSRPLSSYFFEVALTMYKQDAKDAGRVRVGSVSDIVEEASFSGVYQNRVRLPVNFYLQQYTFDFFHVTVFIYERGTGAQKRIYQEGGYVRDIMRNFYQFDRFPVKRLLAPPEHSLMLLSSVMITSRGCAARCDCEGRLQMFHPSPSCPHCVCESQWQCLHKAFIDVDFEIELDGESHGEFLTQEQILTLFNEKLVYA